MPAPVLIDVSCQCPEHTDATLEFIFKALGDDPGDAIWDKHPNPLIRRIVEMFTRRGMDRVSGLRDELQRWIAGAEHHPSAAGMARPIGAMVRWTPTELGMTRAYLEALAPEQFELEDWGLLVDYLVQRYLPAGDMRADADWLSTRSNIMGRVQAVLEEPTESQADTILAALPATREAAGDVFGLTHVQRAVMAYGNAHCADNVVAWTDAARLRLRRVVMDYAEAQMLGDKAKAASSLETRLLDEFGTMNRDWRRIAVTEAGENMNQGMIASLKPGTRVKRVEKYRGACAFCRSIDGKIMLVVAPGDADKDGAKQVWVGKTNLGRSASPRRRVGGELVDREPHEMWWIPAGTVHPNCRGVWIPLGEPTRKVDPKFSAWMDDVLKRNPT
jgi:hypothetical protein